MSDETRQSMPQDAHDQPEPLMELEGFTVGPIRTNCYLYKSVENGEQVGIIIDPGDQGTEIADHLPSGMRIKYIVSTHGHNDHTGGVYSLRERTGAKYGIHQADEEEACHAKGPDEFGLTYEADAPRADFYLTEGLRLELGAASFVVMEVPGHTPGSVILRGEGKASGLVFTGDTLFKGSIGRVDLPGGDASAMRRTIERLKRELDPESHIFPGHGDPSRFYKELANNPFLQEDARI